MVKNLSDREIESIASRVLKAYIQLPEIQNTKIFFVDPTLLLNSLLGLQIEYKHLSDNGKILGLTSYFEMDVELPDSEDKWLSFDGKNVFIEKTLKSDSKQTGRCNFTIVHEGCHHIFNQLFPDDCRNCLEARKVLCFRSSDFHNASIAEQQVNKLASAILMPKFLIQQGMFTVGLPDRIDILNRIWRREEYNKFCELASLLGVSKQALAIRMEKLNLIGRNDLKNPYRMMDVYVQEGDFYD